MNKKAVGPLDIKAFLADIKSGKIKPRTASVEIYLDPAGAARYNELVDQYNALVEADKDAADQEVSIADDGPADRAAELQELADQIDAEMEAFEASKATFTFRTQIEGDREAIDAAVKANEGNAPSMDTFSLYGTAQYSTDGLSVADLRAMIPVIGWNQYTKLVDTWYPLVFGVVSAPKSRKPSTGRATETL